MASHKAFVDYITEQLGGAGEIRAENDVWRVRPVLRRAVLCRDL